mmetsp:Transcript_9933/g.17855  ORF Transcript_9933/g.17855 Transcript_9933/m.17855 type:complete len:118 (+) Transcript_9933:107-460(+)
MSKIHQTMKTDSNSPKFLRIMLSCIPDVKTKTLDIKNLSEDDLKSLRKNDPFLYHSIPGIRRAAIFHKSIDHSNMDALCQGQATRRVDTLQDSETPKKTTEITRRSRISFEADLRLI